VCARIFYLILAGLFAFMITAIAAFYFLEWWQATVLLIGIIIASSVVAKYLLRSAIYFWGEKLTSMVDRQGKVLQNASVQFHTVNPAEPPREMTDHDEEYEDIDEETARDLRQAAITKDWYKIEMTIFPNPDVEEHTQPWSPEALTFVPYESSPPKNLLRVDEEYLENIIHFEKLKVLSDKPHDEGITGPQRLRVLVGFPKDMRDFALRYFNEQFGRLRLPGSFVDKGRYLGDG
jgi:hypothetical protein